MLICLFGESTQVAWSLASPATRVATRVEARFYSCIGDQLRQGVALTRERLLLRPPPSGRAVDL